MKNEINLSLWNQFGASIEMLENAIKVCPDEHWNSEKRFWYNAFHCLFFLDYYLCTTPKTFSPTPPFTTSEFEDKMPERVYSKVELLAYLAHSQKKAKSLIFALNEEKLNERWINSSGSMDYSIFEIILYNMRHVQHHAAQLNMILRQEIGNAPEWVYREGELKQ
ncbi:DinB family protein [Lacihabitans sp. LS3-19]|uniref:DinB family protein n=1 Tax=Lacihabitans sp. LS3-19 TaxID=2487335 RepID=UPI0020CC494A|nr:DinB family protein [Lacihabitans sp. LS3-19]MCP9766599.1 DinB family protein [Lacihabitans sp. LS3-19]